MDDQNNSDQSDSSDDHKEIDNGFFGIIDSGKNGTARSDCEDEEEMDTDDQTVVNNDKSSEDAIEESSSKQLTNDCSETIENPSFGSQILELGSKEFNSSELPSSFAVISKNYENSKIHVVETSKDDSQVPQLESKCSTKQNLQSLSLISDNYQDSSSESDELSDEGEKYADSDDALSIISVSSEPITAECVKTRGELDITELPPIEDLKISVDEEKCQPVGCIKSFVDTLVVVEAFLNQPALDIDSVLFLDRGKRALGKIFDVFGPVNKPYYAVRFNNSDHIKKFNVVVKEPVFCAPETEHSSFVLISQLLKMKGSDASWRDNNEPPPEHLDYSDDEAEKIAKKKRKQKKKKNERNNDDMGGDSPDPPGQNNASSSRLFSGDSAQHPSFHRNFKQSPRAYSPRPSNYTPQSPAYAPQSANYTPHRPNLTIPPPNFNLRPPNFNPNPPNFNRSPPNFNRSPQNFNPGPQNYGYDQRPPFLSYAQQLSAMDYNHTYRQPFCPQFNNQNLYPQRPNFPYHNQQMPQGYSHQPFPQNHPNNSTRPPHMHFPQ